MKIGDRVVNTQTGGLGYIEEIEDTFVSIRNLTPDNVLSCCVSWSVMKYLQLIPDNVLPMPRSKEWKRQSKEFYDRIVSAIEEMT